MRPSFALGLAFASWFLATSAFAQDGYPDLTFSSDGLLIVGWSGDSAEPNAIAARPDGSLFIAGEIEEAAGQNVAVVKIGNDGKVDLNWGLLGRRRIAFDAVPGASDQILNLSPLNDGSLLVAGLSTVESDFYYKRLPVIARLTPSGSLDSGFANAGIAVINMPWATDNWWWEDAIVQRDGKIVFFGYCEDCPDQIGQVRPMLLRIGLDGAPDLTFSGDGWAVPTSSVTNGLYPYGLSLDSQGRILMVGQTLGGAVLRFTTGGALDTTFGGGSGLASFVVPSGAYAPYSFTVDQNSGAMFFGFHFSSGTYEDYAGVQRFSPAGVLDSTFAGDGLAEFVFDNRTWISQMQVQSDGRLIGVGLIEPGGPSNPDFFLFRLLANGVLDTTFHANGVRRVTFNQDPDVSDWAQAMTISGGRLVAVGKVTTPTARSFGVTRVTSALVFADGFERATTAGWSGN